MPSPVAVKESPAAALELIVLPDMFKMFILPFIFRS